MRTTFALTLLFALLFAVPTQASILIGSSTGVDTVANVNDLINTYYMTTGVQYINSMTGKLEDNDGGTAIIMLGPMTLADVDIFEWDRVQAGVPTGTKTLNVFDRNSMTGNQLGFSDTEVVYGSNTFSGLDNPVFALESASDKFEFYVVKSGSGFTVWQRVAGTNVAYASADGVALGDTEIANGNVFDPYPLGSDARAVSHISFYGTSAVPEPATLAMWSLFGACGGLFVMHRRRQAKK